MNMISFGSDKKKVLSWCLYDFANSSYSAVIASVVFPVYYATIIVGNETGQGDLWWGRALSLSMAFVAMTSPLLGALADVHLLRKKLLVFYTYLCITATACFSTLEKGMVIEGFLLITAANIGMEGAIVFYNSFLKDITKTEFEGRVSAAGFGLGYAGSIISLILAFLFIKIGYINYVWPMVSLFLLIFSLPLFLLIKESVKLDNDVTYIVKLEAFMILIKNIWHDKDLKKFLFAYFLYEDGINTVIIFSSIFAATTLKFTQTELILLYLIVQFTALIGAFGMSYYIDYWGPKRVVTYCLILWTLVCISAYFVQSKTIFAFIAMLSGFGLGTVQAGSRAFFAQFIPKGREGAYFGVYSTVGKTSAILGPIIFGEVSAMAGSQRPAVLAVALMFLTGLFIISKVKRGGPNFTKIKI